MIVMLSYTILLYENDHRTARHFSGIAAELGMSVIEAQTPEEVRLAVDQHFFELALVNINLPPIALHPETKCILYGEPDKQSISQINRLRPNGIISHPFNSAVTHYTLIKTSGLVPAARNLPCLFIEIESLVQEKLFRLKALLERPEYHLPLESFPDRYCGQHCAFAIPAQDIPTGEANKYQTLGTTSARGHMVCAFKNDCRLFRLATMIKQEQPALGLPAAALLTTKDIDKAAPDELTVKLRKTAASYQSLTEGLLGARHQLCNSTCHTPDENGILGSTIKKKCCAFGCVLDNYFDLTPPKEVLTCSKALIYDNDTPETKALIFLCKDFGMEPFCTSNPKAAQQHLSTAHIPFAFINPELERISIPHNTRVVIVDELSIGMVARIMNYRPVGIIPKPIDISTLSLAFTKALNIPFTQESFLSLLSNIEMELNAAYMSLNSWLFDEIHKYELKTSVKYFCENYCSFAIAKTALSDKDMSKYYLLNPFTKRGALYCPHKPHCKLWKLNEDSLCSAGEDLDQSPAEFLRRSMPIEPGNSLIDQMTTVHEQAGARADKLNALRHHYCTQICDKKCADFMIKKGDILFSTLNEILASNVYVYCKEQACPVMHFFLYFRRTMT